jgi:hypothetical protein
VPGSISPAMDREEKCVLEVRPLEGFKCPQYGANDVHSKTWKEGREGA